MPTHCVPALAAAAVLAALLVTSPSHARPDSTIDMVRTVAREFSVPPEFLWAIAQVQSGGIHRAHVARDGAVGLLGLRVDGARPSLPLGAALAGEDPVDAAACPAAHLRSGAALLAFYRDLDPASGTPNEDWVRAATAFAGTGEPDAIAAFLDELMGILARGGLRVGEPPPMPFAPVALPVTDLIEPWIASSRAAEYPGASWSAAAECNYTTSGPRDIDHVIVHVAQGSYSGTISWFKNCAAEATTHYVIRSSDGAVTQMVLEKDIAWHAGNWDYNVHSIGFEMEGYVDDPGKWFTDALYSGAAKLTAYICDKYGIPKDRSHVIGHNEVPGCPSGNGGGSSCHTDPGPGWNWDKFMALVKGEQPPVGVTGDLTGFIREGDIYTGPDIVGADVKLSNGWATKSGSNGLYKFTGVPVGVITVTASAAGYKTKSDTKDIQGGILNWKSIALEKGGCTADCSGKECGDDGCGGSCGQCPGGVACEAGKCGGGCKLNDHKDCCGKAVCWFDSCGNPGVKVEDCANGCAAGGCTPTCQPDCAGKDCGPDGCGGSCGVCPAGELCAGGSYKCVCAPMDHKDCCGSAVCWFDGCGAEGSKVIDCPNGCQGGQCAGCKPACGVKECGGDGCGGSCGECGQGQTCVDGICACQDDHHKACCGKAICWYDSCGVKGSKVLDCPAGCQAGECLACLPDCTGRECGNDGCGGSCGYCGVGSGCVEGQCKPVQADSTAPPDKADTGADAWEVTLAELPVSKDASADSNTQGKSGGGCASGPVTGGIGWLVSMLSLAVVSRRRV